MKSVLLGVGLYVSAFATVTTVGWVLSVAFGGAPDNMRLAFDTGLLVMFLLWCAWVLGSYADSMIDQGQYGEDGNGDFY